VPKLNDIGTRGFSMNIQKIEDEELRFDWLMEARRRSEELDNGKVQAVSGEDVMRKARALIK
tara:strand:- start:223 stop:408 length:186 start_codon:yes stop_codon:yes gene_type:complete